MRRRSRKHGQNLRLQRAAAPGFLLQLLAIVGGHSPEEETMLLDVKLSRRLLFCIIGAAVCTSGIGESSHYLEDEPPRVHPLFQLSVRAASPFPSDIFTLVDAAQATGPRVNFPYPDCAARPSDCDDIETINTLDGFGLNPRISIPF